eukprot:2899744-Rhodomonas_salina.2
MCCQSAVSLTTCTESVVTCTDSRVWRIQGTAATALSGVLASKPLTGTALFPPPHSLLPHPSSLLPTPSSPQTRTGLRPCWLRERQAA